MELGIFTFGDHTNDPVSGKKISAEQRMKNLIEEIKLTEEVGLDLYGTGEHHRSDYLISSPIVPLAAGAAITERIKLMSAVTVLSSDDPVRVFQDFAELDLVSGGRAEIIVGRGSFIESFPLFGYSLDDYHELFTEKLQMLLKIRESEDITWNSKFTQKIDDKKVLPRPVQDPLPIWIATGGNPSSIARAAKLGLPVIIAIIGGQPAQFKEAINIYWKLAEEEGYDLNKMRVGVGSHGFIAEDKNEALEYYYPYYEKIMNKLGQERGWGPTSRSRYDMETSPAGALLVGDPKYVADKIIYEQGLFNNNRFALQISISSMPHEKVMKAIELFGTEVAPIVREELGGFPHEVERSSLQGSPAQS